MSHNMVCTLEQHLLPRVNIHSERIVTEFQHKTLVQGDKLRTMFHFTDVKKLCDLQTFPINTRVVIFIYMIIKKKNHKYIHPPSLGNIYVNQVDSKISYY